MTSDADNFIEVSFEAANKVGGIYQVLKSKSAKMQDFYGENYTTIGFYDEESARSDFAKRENPHKEIFEELEHEGIKCHYGVWNIQSSPTCILVDASEMEKSADEIKQEMWKEHGIDSMNAGNDFDEPVKWSYAVGKLVKKLVAKQEGETVVQLHEWLSSPAMFNFDAPTVFTTHATVLGRALSNSDFDLLGAVEEGHIDDSLAEDYCVGAKHQLEKAAAENSDAFTTVSKTTGREATAVLDTEPDKILPNGFNVEAYPSLEELSYNHTKKKKELKEFLSAYFEPYYDINLEDDPRTMFISGRYEYHNKGVDVLIDALSQLNEQEGDDFFVFIFVPSDTKGPKPEVLDNMSLYDELEDHVDDLMPDIRSRILSSVAACENPIEQIQPLLESNTLESLRRNFHEKQEAGLTNGKDDRVKVIFYPTYLSVGDKLLSMSYNDAIVASSAGIFPSYYEPWGYTPVETAANGALSITTDLAGFGQFLEENTDEEERKGIRVLSRRNQSDDEVADELAGMIDDIIGYSKTEITERKHNARKLAQMTSWDKLGENYREAHSKAVNNHQ
jgi:glycogen(starch) synthase